MTESEDKSLEILDEEQKKKVQELLEKDAASGRNPKGFWRWIAALLGGGMVLFYFYTAGLASVATQFHRGVYVLVTYVLVFLLYPSRRDLVPLPARSVCRGADRNNGQRPDVLPGCGDVPCRAGRVW